MGVLATSCRLLAAETGRCWGLGEHVLFLECIHLLWAVYLDMGDEGERIGEIEILACWGSWVVGHSEIG